jgi:FdhD protein
MVEQVNIIRLDLSTGKSQTMVDYVAEEKPFYLLINSTFWATILCSPKNIQELAVGHFLSEGIIKSTEEIEEVIFKESESTCYLKLKLGIKVEDRVKVSRLHARIIHSACGDSSSYQDTNKLLKVKSSLNVKAQIIFDSVNQLNFKAEGYRRTGGFHVAAIYKADGQLIALAEDVGRHNAVDKVIGMAVALNQIDFGECFLAMSGRMSGDVVFKAANVGLPIIASLASALSSGITMAISADLTLAGFVRGKRINIYTKPERITK